MMHFDELRQSLLLMGVAVIGGVWLFNQTQLWRARRKRARHVRAAVPSSRSESPLASRIEPLLKVDQLEVPLAPAEIEQISDMTPIVEMEDSSGGAVSVITTPAPVVTMPSIIESEASDIAVTEVEKDQLVEERALAEETINIVALTPITLEPVISPLIDCIVQLPLDRPVASERILSILSQFRHVGNKAVHCEGLNLLSQRREPICAGQRYSDLCLAVQLANRQGVLHAIEFSEFTQHLQHLAKSLDTPIVLPEMVNVLAQAHELDTFAQQNDVQLQIHVRGLGQPWSAAQIKNRFVEDGLVLSRDGRYFIYEQPIEDKLQPIFTARFQDIHFLNDDLLAATGTQIDLCFDAPRVIEDIHPFRLMWSYAQYLSKSLEAEIVDDRGQPLQVTALAIIETRLQEIYTRLRQHGIPAGLANALRLFNQ